MFLQSPVFQKSESAGRNEREEGDVSGWLTGIRLARLPHASLVLCLLLAAPAAVGQSSAVQEGALAQEVLDKKAMSELSLERLLDQPVVTAAGKAEARSLASANVFIVTGAEIKQRGYRSLAEILQRVPGMYLIDNYVNASVGVREVTGGYRGGTRIVKIMVDGYPVNFRPDLEALIGPEFIPVETIERVEVAKGPLSALYGANAFLATVNVITKEPEASETVVSGRFRVINGNPGSGASAMASYAGENSSLMLAATAEQGDRSGVSVSQTYRFQDLSDPVFSSPSAGDTSRPTSLYARYDYHALNYGDFRLQAGHQELNSGAEFQLNSVLTHRSRVHLVNDWASLHWQHRPLEQLKLRAHVGGAHGAPGDDYQLFLTGNLSSGFKPRFDYTALNALVEASYEMGPWLQVDLGADAELRDEGVLYYTQVSYRQDAKRRAFDETDLIGSGARKIAAAREFGTYLQLHSAPVASLPDLRLNGSARADFINFGPVRYPVQMSVRGAVAYRISPDLTAKVVAGRAFQTPSGTLLFAHGGFGNIQNLIGSERLDEPRPIQPQVVTSAELMVLGQAAGMATLEGSVYYQELSDAIRFNQVGAIIVGKNSGREVTVGGELIAQLHLRRFKPYVALSFSRQLEAELTRDLAGITSFGGSPSMYPRLFGYAGADTELIPSRLYLNAELRFANERGASQANFYQNDSRVYDLPGYYELDLTLSTGDLHLWAPDVSTRLVLSLRNAMNSNRIEPGFAGVDIPQPSRAMFMQLTQEL